MRRELRSRPSTKKRGLPRWAPAAYLLLMPLVLYMLPIVIMASFEMRAAWLGDLLDVSYLSMAGPAALCVPFLQVMFLMPAAPVPHASRPGLSVRRWLVASIALGGLVAMCILPVLAILREGFQVGIWIDPGISYAFPIMFVPAILLASVFVRYVWRRGIPVRASLALAGALCGLLVGNLALIAQGIGDLFSVFPPDWGLAVGGVVTLLAWAVWTPVLWAYRRNDPTESRLARVAALIFKGTLLELVAVIPLDALTRRRTSCYCSDASFFSLILCGSVGLIALGPAVFLLPSGRRAGRLMQGACEHCGYDLHGVRGPCPECGAPGRVPADAVAQAGLAAPTGGGGNVAGDAAGATDQVPPGHDQGQDQGRDQVHDQAPTGT